VTRPLAIALPVLLLIFTPRFVLAQKLDLSVSPRTIAFPTADPDVVPTMSAAPITVQVRVRQLLPIIGQWHLSVLANGDLVSGSSTIPVTNVTWTATPAPPFQNGTLSRTTAQRMAGGTGNLNPAVNGSVTFRLVNSWTYTAGTYTQTLVFTLSSP
jgi:hypothetical protein